MFIPFALVPHFIGKDLTPRAAVQVLVPVMAALELELPQLTQFLLAACTKTADNHPPVTVQDQTEVGLLHTLPRMFKVDNAWRANILHWQLPSLQPGGSGLTNSVVSIQNIAISTKDYELILFKIRTSVVSMPRRGEEEAYYYRGTVSSSEGPTSQSL